MAVVRDFVGVKWRWRGVREREGEHRECERKERAMWEVGTREVATE